MLLTITYRGVLADDLGYLLHKNPRRPQQFDMSFGKAYVFYPVLEDERCTAALLLDINPIDLARGKLGSRDGGLFDYVNDRPYVASSFMSTAIARIFGTAMSGRCDKRPELAARTLPLEATLSMLPCAGDIGRVERIFEPLGYQVEYRQYPLDEAFPEWGEGRYIDLMLKGEVRLCDLLNHLYVLIPVFDRQKHYWIDENEIAKLLTHGEGWLASHPEKTYITHRYFHRKKRFAFAALEQLIDEREVESAVEEAPSGEETPAREEGISLNRLRLDTVAAAVHACGAASVLDLGCGEGQLLERLLRDPQVRKVTAMDVSMYALERARQRVERMPPALQGKISLLQGALTYRDKRMEGHDAACLVEVIEHMDLSRLPALERVVFEFAAPQTVIVTTPNAEYNVNYASLAKGALRHADHRFEWTLAQFQAWAGDVAERFGYGVAFQDIGEACAAHGTPTQMGVFTKCV